MTSQDRSGETHARGRRAPSRKGDRAHRKALVEEMVRGAILPGLLARKDDGAFDRGPNVVRFPVNGDT
jgi:hypothetical protein